ncbi:MAG: HAD hydrolase-like protein, partial [Clostridia bacterium]
MNEKIAGVIFDLDGVLVSTDNCHYLAWKRMADEEGIDFDRKVNERLRGVSRMESLDILLERAAKPYTEDEKAAMAARKNAYYVTLIGSLTEGDVLPGALA